MKRLLTPLLLACVLAVLCLGSCIYETDKKIAPPPRPNQKNQQKLTRLPVIYCTNGGNGLSRPRLPVLRLDHAPAPAACATQPRRNQSPRWDTTL